MRGTHVWIADRFTPALQTPGLLLDWHEGADGWEGLCTYVDKATVLHKVVTEWIAAERLTPVPWRPSMGTAYG